MGETALRIISVGFVPSALSLITSAVFESVGKGLLSLSVTLLRQLVIVLPLAFLFSPHCGTSGRLGISAGRGNPDRRIFCRHLVEGTQAVFRASFFLLLNSEIARALLILLRSDKEKHPGSSLTSPDRMFSFLFPLYEIPAS